MTITQADTARETLCNQNSILITSDDMSVTQTAVWISSMELSEYCREYTLVTQRIQASNPIDSDAGGGLGTN